MQFIHLYRQDIFIYFTAILIMYCSLVVLCRRAHRLTVLIIFSMVLVYVALWEGVTHDSDYNTKRLVLFGKH